MKRLVTMMAVAALAISMVAVPASAGPPEVEFEFEATFGPDPFIPCDGFGSMITTEISVRHVHHDIGRNRVQHKTWISGVDTVWNADEPEKMVSGKFTQTDIAIAPEGEPEVVKIHGKLWHLTAPGFGTVFQETGQLILDFSLPGDPFVSFTGKSDWATGSFDDLCEALS